MHATIELLSTFSLNIFDFSGRWKDRVIQKKIFIIKPQISTTVLRLNGIIWIDNQTNKQTIDNNHTNQISIQDDLNMHDAIWICFWNGFWRDRKRETGKCYEFDWKIYLNLKENASRWQGNVDMMRARWNFWNDGTRAHRTSSIWILSLVITYWLVYC